MDQADLGMRDPAAAAAGAVLSTNRNALRKQLADNEAENTPTLCNRMGRLHVVHGMRALHRIGQKAN